MKVTEDGMDMEAKVHPSNAPALIEVTEDGMEYTAPCFPAGYNIRAVLALLKRTPSDEL